MKKILVLTVLALSAITHAQAEELSQKLDPDQLDVFCKKMASFGYNVANYNANGTDKQNIIDDINKTVRDGSENDPIATKIRKMMLGITEQIYSYNIQYPGTGERTARAYCESHWTD